MHARRPTRAAPGLSQQSSFHKLEDSVHKHKRARMACDRWGQAGQCYAFLNLIPLYRAISPHLIIQTSWKRILHSLSLPLRLQFTLQWTPIGFSPSLWNCSNEAIRGSHSFFWTLILFISTFNSLWVTDLLGKLTNAINLLSRKFIHTYTVERVQKPPETES